MNDRHAHLIIEASQNQSSFQRITTFVFTGFFWLLWFYLWTPLLGPFLLDSASASPEHVVQTDSRVTLVITIFIVAAACSLALVVWARVNRFRFANKQRRGTYLTTNDSDRADFFNLDEAKIVQAKKRKIITVHFDDRIMRVQLTDRFVRDLKAEGSPYIVADVECDGLRVRVRPNGEKRYLYRRDRTSTVTLGDPIELSLDDARRQAADLATADVASVKRRRQYGPSTTLEEFVKRHYKPYRKSESPDPAVIEPVLAQFGSLRERVLNTITKDEIVAWQDELLIGDLGEAEILQRMEMLRALFTRAVSWGAITQSPMRGVDIYRVPIKQAA